MNKKIFVLALATAAGTAFAQNSIVNDVAGTFVDISGMGGAVAIYNGAVANDDVNTAITTSVTNAVFTATTLRVCTNGFVQFGGTTGATTWTNAAIAAGTASPLAPTTTQTLMPFWDDQILPANSGENVYWIEGPAASFGLPASRGNVLIIQWNNISHYNGGLTPVGNATYEVQIFQNVVNNVAAQMLYSNVAFGDPVNMDDGVSATVGFASGTTGGSASLGNVQWGFNTAGSVTAGTVLSILTPAGPTNPTVNGVGAAAAAPGDTVLYTANASGGLNPNSTGLSVHGDLTAVGGSSNALFHDDGLNGDAVAGDHVYSFQYTIPGATSGGNYSVALTVTDAQSRSGTGSLTGYIFNPQDLGTLVDGTDVSVDVPVAPGEIKWFKATIDDCSVSAHRSLTVTTGNSTAGGDSEIGFYSADGTLITSNDDSVGLLSKLTFGYQGTSGDVGPGVYYIAVGTFNVTFASGFSATSTGTATNDFQLDLLENNSFPATATGAASITADGALFQVTVTPGTNPDTTGVVVTGDVSGLGGSSSQAFFDDGTHGDLSAGDNVYSFVIPIPTGTTDGQAFTASYTVTDDQSDTLTGDMSITGGDINNTIATATVLEGSGQLDSISDNFDFGADVDMFKISICDSGNFSASTVGGTTADTHLYLFNADGTGVTADDDDPSGSGLQSIITGVFVPGNGDYYLAVTRYTMLPVDDGGNTIWNNTIPFAVERQPDGAGAGGSLAGWTGGSAGTNAYTVALTGTCYPTTGPSQCSAADVGIAGGLYGQDHHLDNNDFISFISLFFAQSPVADMGMAGGLAGSDGQWDNNDFIAFINHFFADSGACNGG